MLPWQGAQVRFLVEELDPACCVAWPEDLKKGCWGREALREGCSQYLWPSRRMERKAVLNWALISGGSLKTEWAGGIVGEDLLICTVSAEGALETTRPTHVRTGSNIDLRDGHEITAGSQDSFFLMLVLNVSQHFTK